MKLVKLLIVPAVALLSLGLAVPAFAHSASLTITSTCDTHTGKICVDLKGTLADDNDARTIILGLFPAGSQAQTPLETLQITLPSNRDGKHSQFDSGSVCFDAVKGVSGPFDVKYLGTVGDQDLALTINDKPVDKGDVVLKGVATCTATSPSPSPSASASAPAATPSATPVATLAQTGGFDFRYPIIGLAVVVVGLGLFLVSMSRGRRTTGSK